MNMRILAACAALATVGFASGCGEDGPFSLTVTNVNEKGPQRSAVIAISDPQIYTRERLLNDRDDEVTYLQTQLKNIDSQDFTPRLKRDLDELVEIAATLQAKVNPIAGSEVTQAAQINELSNDVQIERLKNLLADVKAQRTPADASAVGTTPANTNTSALGSTTDLDEVIKTTQSMLDKLQSAVASQNTNRPPIRTNTVTSATPIEVLRDKLAYRNEIQSALEQAQLDDRHDLNGNALYRLQFKATIFPGQVKDKYGVARLTILPPVFDDKRDVSKLYLDWLAYVASQLNSGATDPKKGAPRTHEQDIADQYRLLGEATGIYRVVPIPFSPDAKATAADVAVGASSSNPDGGATSLSYALYSDVSINVHDTTPPENSPAQKAEKVPTPTPGTQGQPNIVPGTPDSDAEECKAKFSTPVDSLSDKKSDPSDKDSSTKQTAGKFLAPLPPGVPQDQVLAALIGPCSRQLVRYFDAATTTLETYARNQDAKGPLLRWKDPEQNGCSQLEKTGGASPSLIFDLDQANYTPTEVTSALKASLTTTLASRASQDSIGQAFVIAQNIHNLAPAYILGLQRSIAALQRGVDDASASVNTLQDFAQSMSTAAASADRLLGTLHDAVLNPISLKLYSLPDPRNLKDLILGNPNDDIYAALAPGKSPEDVRKTLEQVEKDQKSQFDRKKLLNDVEETVSCLALNDLAGSVPVPDTFYENVTGSRGDNFPINEQKPYGGDTYAYSTAPSELAQRISTVASATQALDLMAAVSALIPQAGTSLSASGELRQIAAGHVDAIESAPLIVGFSNSGAANVEGDQFGARPSLPSFGWVFGPKVIVDAAHSKLELSQTLVEQPVTADISVPGWWRTLRLRVETAWAANFDKALLAPAAVNGESEPDRQPSNRATDYIVNVPLQTNPATYEQLTEFIANKTWGLQYKLPVITHVEPVSIPACTGMTLLVSGPDLWRGRQVYLNGILASAVRIMPDMQGLEATFDLSKSKPGKATLTVWTQLGQAHSDDVAIAKGDTCAPQQQQTQPKATVLGPLVLIPKGTMKVAIDKHVSTDQPYYLVIHLADKKDTAVLVNADETDPAFKIDGKTNTFTFTMPEEQKVRDSLKLTDGKKNIIDPPEGVQMSIDIHAKDPDKPDILATISPLFFYQKTLPELLDAAPGWSMDTQRNVTVPLKLPSAFSDAFGKTITATISGFKNDKNTPEDIVGKPLTVQADNNTGQISFALPANWNEVTSGGPITVVLSSQDVSGASQLSAVDKVIATLTVAKKH